MTFTPGIYPSMSMRDYLAIEAVSSSMIRDVDEHCPAFARWRQRNPEQGESATMRRGTAIHARLLEPEAFPSRYVQVAGCQAILVSGKRKGQPCLSQSGRLAVKDGADTFLCGVHDDPLLLDASREALAMDLWEDVTGVAEAARAIAGPVLDAATHRETVLLWNDPETGLPMKARPDLISMGRIYDLKTLADMAPQRWGSVVLASGMHIQAVHYVEGAQALGLDVGGFAWIVVRNERPYLAAVHPPMDVASADVSEVMWRDRLNELAAHWSDARWPSYEVPEATSLPTWFLNSFGVGV